MCVENILPPYSNSFLVYSFGVYVDEKSAVKNISTKWGKYALAKKDPSFYGELLKYGVNKAVRMVFVRNVTGDDVRESFQEKLEPRLRSHCSLEEGDDVESEKNGTAKDRIPPKEALAQFRAPWSTLKIAKNSELTFRWQGLKMKCFCN